MARLRAVVLSLVLVLSMVAGTLVLPPAAAGEPTETTAGTVQSNTSVVMATARLPGEPALVAERRALQTDDETAIADVLIHSRTERLGDGATR